MCSTPSLTKSNQPVATARAIDVSSGAPRLSPERHLPLAARRADIAKGLVVLAQKGAPVLGDVEAAMGGVAVEIDLDRRARLVCAGAADAYPSRAAAAAGQVDRDASVRRFGNRLRRDAVAISSSGEDRCRLSRKFGQGDGEDIVRPIGGGL